MFLTILSQKHKLKIGKMVSISGKNLKTLDIFLRLFSETDKSRKLDKNLCKLMSLIWYWSNGYTPNNERAHILFKHT